MYVVYFYFFLQTVTLGQGDSVHVTNHKVDGSLEKIETFPYSDEATYPGLMIDRVDNHFVSIYVLKQSWYLS